MKVRNINGTSDNTCKCRSWINHWEKYAEKTATMCSATACFISKDLVGAHVQKDDSNNKSWYIIPFCEHHNKKTEEIEVWSSTILVSANVNETCGK